MTEKLRVRFAPSPTGPLHIGGARSALFNWLLARQSGGQFILRVEDTDTARSSRESEENIKAALLWLGLDWDEGIDKGGDYGPYRQSERLDLYKEHTKRLLAEGKAYRCFCSEEDLAAERQKQMDAGLTPRYSGTCCNLSLDTVEDKLKAQQPFVVRIKTPIGKKYSLCDEVRGEVSFDSDGIGDFVIVKTDGMPVYNYAVVIDDLTMDVNLVIRGEEHLSNTPRQLVLYEALGCKPPHFAHVSLILGRDRTKMSKRHGATAVEQYWKNGYLPAAIVNFLALLGWSPEDDQEIFSLDELIAKFSLARVAKNPAVFDSDKLNWLNGQYIKQITAEQLLEISTASLQADGWDLKGLDAAERDKLLAAIEVVKDHVSYGGELSQHLQLFFDESAYIADDAVAVLSSTDEVKKVADIFLDRLRDIPMESAAIKTILKETAKESGLPNKKVFMPLRVLLTGFGKGPDLDKIIPIIGREAAIKRITGRLTAVC